MIPNINFDTILSDPLLLVACSLLLLAPLVFLIAAIKFLRAPKEQEHSFSLPEPEALEPEPTPEPVIEPSELEQAVEEVIPSSPPPPPEPPVAPVRVSTPPAEPHDMDRTVVLPAGVAEIQGQMGIAFSQIKTLNKKVYELESEIESMAQHAANKLEMNELKEPPVNAADYMQKLLKLAEHVIMLEKEMARMRGEKAAAAKPAPVAAPAPTQATAATPGQTTKPPIMPL